MAKNYFVVCSVFYLLLIISDPSIVLGATTNQDWDTGGSSGSGDDVSKELNDAIANGESYSGSAPANTQVNLPDGGSATVSGNVVVSSGKIASADKLSYGFASIAGAKDFEQSAGGYSVSSASELRQNSNIITNGQGITFSNGKLSAQSYDSFAGPDATTSGNGQGLAHEQNTLSVEKADFLLSGEVNFRDIENTGFEIYSDAVIARPKINTTLNIIDPAGNEVTFEPINNDSEIIVSKTTPPKYWIRKGRLKHTYSNITESVTANDSVVMEMGHLGFKCMEVKPIGAFWHLEKYIKDFSINIPPDSDYYRLCLKKLPSDNITSYDGLVDYTANYISLDGIVKYLRYPFRNSTQVDYSMQPAYEGKSKETTALMLFDKDMIMIDDLLLSIKKNATTLQAVTYAGFHMITEQDNRYDIIQDNFNPYIIRHYHSSNIPLNISFPTKKPFQNILLQPNPQLHTSVKVYPPTNETLERLERDLAFYYEENNMEK